MKKKTPKDKHQVAAETLLSILFSLQLDRDHYGMMMRMTQPTGTKKAYAQGQVDELKRVIGLLEGDLKQLLEAEGT